MSEHKLERVKLEISDRVATLTYCNPPVNATDTDAYDELTKAFQELNGMDVGAVVFRTEGKGFMAGNDIHELQGQSPKTHAAYQERLINAFESIVNCSHPVIGAVQGYALGAGFVFAACCDFVVASEDAFFALPEITLCVISGVGYALKMLPEAPARYLCMTGESLSADEMLQFGAIAKVVPREELYVEAGRIAKRIATLPPHAVTYMKELMNQHTNHEYRRKFKLEDAYTGRLFGMPEKKEAVNAFLEKREAKYSF